MDEVLRGALAVIALVGSGIVAGVFLAVRFSVLPAVATLAPGRYVEMHQELGKGYHPVMPLIVVITLLGQVALVLTGGGTVQRILLGVAVAATVGVQVVSQFGNVPINKRVALLVPSAVPDDWADPRPRWRSWHAVRTAFAVGSVVATAAAVVL